MFHILVMTAIILTNMFLKVIKTVLCLPINSIVCKCYVLESPGKGHWGWFCEWGNCEKFSVHSKYILSQQKNAPPASELYSRILKKLTQMGALTSLCTRFCFLRKLTQLITPPYLDDDDGGLSVRSWFSWVFVISFLNCYVTFSSFPACDNGIFFNSIPHKW